MPYDIAIVTALQEELEPVLNLIGGRDQWQVFTVDNFLHYRGTFTCGSQVLSVVACSLWSYGGDATTAQVIRLKQLQPRLLVMTGICAGWQAKGIQLGDVIVADRAFQAGQGKQTITGMEHDIRTYQSPMWLLQWLKEFAHNQQWSQTIATPRPRSLRYQAEWLLCKKKVQGSTFPSDAADWTEIKQNSIDYPRTRALLTAKEYLTRTGACTNQAEELLDGLRQQHYGEFVPTPDTALPHVHYKAFTSSQAVIAVPDPFTELSQHVRGLGALEMEVASLLSAATEIGVAAFAVKGVSDYGTPDKDDLFHTYAAEAAARWMYAFICQYAMLLDTVLPARSATVPEADAAPRSERASQPRSVTAAASADIDHQQQLLETHRRTLASYLKRLGIFGAAYAPPEIDYGIRDARQGIRRAKSALRGWGVPCEDRQDDEPE